MSCPFGGGSGFGETGDITEAEEFVLDPALQTVQQPTDRIDFQLDDDGDLLIDSDIYFTSGLAAVAQGIQIRLKSSRGEWFLDIEDGVPYYQDILGQKFNEIKIRTAFRDAILAAPGVNELTTLEVEFDRQTRELDVSWKVVTTFGVTEDELVMEI